MKVAIILSAVLFIAMISLDLVKANVNAAAVAEESAVNGDVKEFKLVKRAARVEDRFQFSADDGEAPGCCPCGTHSCCGSMCHG